MYGPFISLCAISSVLGAVAYLCDMYAAPFHQSVFM